MKLLLSILFCAPLLLASDPWTKTPDKWSARDTDRILTSSPWAQTANASFAGAEDREPPPGPLPGAESAGMAGSRGATDGRWDGGVGKNQRGGTPTLPVLIRWDSALPIREAAAHANQPVPVTAGDPAKDYVITVIGLVPAKRYRDKGQLTAASSSDDTIDARDPEELLEGLMSNARLLRHGNRSLAPENVKLDGATGVVHIFFPRTDPISEGEKDVVFTTRFGALTVERTFRLRDMVYRDHLEL